MCPYKCWHNAYLGTVYLLPCRSKENNGAQGLVATHKKENKLKYKERHWFSYKAYKNMRKGKIIF